MIELLVKDYCQSCPDFEPVTEKMLAGNDVTHTFVSCEHRCRCERLEAYLKNTKGE